MLKVWNMVLVSAAFALSLFGDLPHPQRRGQLDPLLRAVRRGAYLLGFIAVVLAVSTAPDHLAAADCCAASTGSSRWSRARRPSCSTTCCCWRFAFAVLWGVVFPILSEAVRGVRCDRVRRPTTTSSWSSFGLPLLFLIGVGPLIAWRRASLGSLVRMFRWPVVSALAAGALLALLGLGLELGRADRVLAVRVRDDHDRPRVRPRRLGPARDRRRLVAARAGRPGRPQPAPLRRLHRAPLDRAAGGRRHRVGRLLDACARRRWRPGQSLQMAGYTLTLPRPRPAQGPQLDHHHGRAGRSRNGGSRWARSRRAGASTRSSSASPTRSTSAPACAADLYTILAGRSTPTAAACTLKVLVNPMVSLIWLAGRRLPAGRA